MNRHAFASGRDDLREELGQDVLRFLRVDTNPTFHSDINIDTRPHFCDTFRHQGRSLHQNRAETPRLHPVRRTAHIEIDLVIAEIFANTRSFSQLRRVRATKLQRNRMFRGIKFQQMQGPTPNNGG